MNNHFKIDATRSVVFIWESPMKFTRFLLKTFSFLLLFTLSLSMTTTLPIEEKKTNSDTLILKDDTGQYYLQLTCSDRKTDITRHLKLYKVYHSTYIYMDENVSCRYKIIMPFESWEKAQQFRIDNPRLVDEKAWVKYPHTVNTNFIYTLEEFLEVAP